MSNGNDRITVIVSAAIHASKENETDIGMLLVKGLNQWHNPDLLLPVKMH